MKEGGDRTLLIVVILAAVGGVLLLLYERGKAAAGSSGGGGVFSTIGNGLGSVMGITQSATEASVQTGETLGGGVKDAAGGVLDIGNDVVHAGGNANPLNWF